MSRFLLGLLGIILPSAAGADTITLGTNFSGMFWINVSTDNGQTWSARQDGGGSVTPSRAIIGGITYDFAAMYCADLFTNASLGATYSATFNKTAVINGQTVTNAGKIAWLMDHVSWALTQEAQFQALQGLIWTLENPTRVAWDSADNTKAANDWYNTFVAELGDNSAPVGTLWWVNPTDGNGQYNYQGFVAYTWAQLPEPASLLLLAPALVPALVPSLGRRRRVAG